MNKRRRYKAKARRADALAMRHLDAKLGVLARMIFRGTLMVGLAGESRRWLHLEHA